MNNHYHFPVFYMPYNWKLEEIYPERRVRRQQEQRGRFVHTRKSKSIRRHSVLSTGKTFYRPKSYLNRITG